MNPVSSGTYSVAEISENKYYWCAWPNWIFKKKPIATGYATTREDAEHSASLACPAKNKVLLKDEYAEKRHKRLVKARRPFKLAGTKTYPWDSSNKKPFTIS